MTMTKRDNESLPKAAHPTAKAFFDALDTRTASLKQSEALKRRSQSLGWRNRYSQQVYYPVTMCINFAFSVQQVQRGEVDGTYGTGATVWPAAMVLIKYLEKNPQLVSSKRVVDLGSGTGVTSIAAALLGATHVICTDGEEPVVRLALDNVNHAATEIKDSQQAKQLSHCATISNCPVAVQKYWWGTGDLPDDSCDVVLVADCVLPKLYPIAPLVQAIDQLLTAENAVAILSYEHRYYPDYDPRDKFRKLATDRGLHVETVSSTDMDPVYSVDDIEIWHVTRRQ
jgi:predicted nicotinamide N-methyase